MNKELAIRFGKFCVVGGTGYALYMLAFFGMQAMHWPELIAVALAPIANILYNFVLHDNWTFRGRTREQA